MRLNTILLAGGLCAASALRAPLAAQQPDSTRLPLDAIVAVIGSVPITWFDVQEDLVMKLQARQQSRKATPTPAELRAMADSVVTDLIDEELLLAKAKDLKVEVADAQIIPTVNAKYRETRDRFKGNQAEFESAIAEAGLGTPEDYKKFLTDDYRRQLTFEAISRKLNQENKLIPVNVTDEDLARAFDGLKGTIPARGATISWRQMVIPPTPSPKARARALAKAESLYAELRRGEDFARLAKRESMDSTNVIGGDRGWARRGELEAEFDILAFGAPGFAPLKPGDFSRPVETKLGVHIYRIDRVQPGQVSSRHIFIRPEIDSTDMAALSGRADSVVKAFLAGTPFDTLTKRYHDYASKEDAGVIPLFPRDSLPASYATAFGTSKVGDVVAFPVPGNGGLLKYVVAEVTGLAPAGEMTLSEVRDRMRDQMSRQGAMRRYLDKLRKETFIVVYMDRAYSFLTAR